MDSYAIIKSFKNWFQIFSAFTVAILLVSLTFAFMFLYLEDEPVKPANTIGNYYPNFDFTPLIPGTLSVNYGNPPDLFITIHPLQANLTYFLLVNHIDTNDGNLFIIRTDIANDTIFLPLKSNSERIEVVLFVIPGQTGVVVSLPLTIVQFVVIDIYYNYEF